MRGLIWFEVFAEDAFRVACLLNCYRTFNYFFSTEGKQLAASREMKFIETSSGIQHNVDELLVGILKQVSHHVELILIDSCYTYDFMPDLVMSNQC